MSNSFIRPIDRNLLGATTPGQCGLETNGNKGLLRIFQSSRITEAIALDRLVLYPAHSLEEPYPSAEMKSVYFADPSNWAIMYK